MPRVSLVSPIRGCVSLSNLSQPVDAPPPCANPSPKIQLHPSPTSTLETAEGGGGGNPMGGMGGGGPMDFGKTKSKFQEVPETGVTFADVAVSAAWCLGWGQGVGHFRPVCPRTSGASVQVARPSSRARATLCLTW